MTDFKLTPTLRRLLQAVADGRVRWRQRGHYAFVEPAKGSGEATGWLPATGDIFALDRAGLVRLEPRAVGKKDERLIEITEKGRLRLKLTRPLE